MSKFSNLAWFGHQPARIVVGTFAAAATVALLSSAPLMAQQPGQPAGQATGQPDAAIGQVLAQFPNGGPEMISRIRELAGNPANLNALIGLLNGITQETATDQRKADQKSALGAGLGQAARIALRTNQGYAFQIQQSVAGTRDDTVQTAFAAVLGDQPIGAGGGCGGGGGGGVGGQTNPLGLGAPGGPAFAFGGGSALNGDFSATGSASAAVGPAAGTGTGTPTTTTSTSTP
jgi:hypothetical protein